MSWTDKFFEATECSPITVILALGIIVLLWVVGKLYFRNTSLSNHIMESDTNNAVVIAELKSALEKVFTADENNADKIISHINNLKDYVKLKGKQ